MKINKKTLVVVTAAALLLTMTSTIIGLITKKRRTRRWGVRPINLNRDKEGVLATLIQSMRNLEGDHTQFFKYTRMTPDLFNCLLSMAAPLLQKDKRRLSLSPEHRLIMTLHYLAEGCSMQEIAWNFRVGKATVSVVVEETCKAIWSALSPKFVKIPSGTQWKDISREFYKRWNIPNCVGSIDGKHVIIKAPKNTGSEFLNYKKSFSLVLMACCDAYYRFTFVDIGAAGGNHDSTVFKNSYLGMSLLNDRLDLPKENNLPNSNLKTNYFVIGDAAFPLHKNIMRPYPGTNLSEKKKIYNYRISRARRTIENSFGILAARWRILTRPLTCKISTCEDILLATVALHNYLQASEQDMEQKDRKYCPTGYVDFIDNQGQLHNGQWREEGARLPSIANLGWPNSTRNAQATRDLLADYFVSKEGWLPWQEDYVNRGGVPN